MSTLGLVLGVALAVGASGTSGCGGAVALDGKSCDDQFNCATGYVCDRSTNLCLRTLDDGGVLLPDGNTVPNVFDDGGTLGDGSDAAVPAQDGASVDDAASSNDATVQLDGATPADGGTFDPNAQWVVEGAGVTASSLNSVAVLATGVAFAVGQNGTILKRSATGSWATVNSGISDELRGVAADGNYVWAVGINGRVVRSSDNGMSFAAFDLSTTTNMNAVEIHNNVVYLAGDSSSFYRGATNASALTQVPLNKQLATLRTLGVISSTLVYLASDQGTIITWKGPNDQSSVDYGGESFASVASTLSNVWVTSNGKVWQTTAGAPVTTPWSVKNVSGDDINSLWAVSDTQLFTAGSAGSIYVGSGGVFTPCNSGSGATLNAIRGAGNFVFAVGSDGTILRKP